MWQGKIQYRTDHRTTHTLKPSLLKAKYNNFIRYMFSCGRLMTTLYLPLAFIRQLLDLLAHFFLRRPLGLLSNRYLLMWLFLLLPSIKLRPFGRKAI